jgi:small subunit ribosomal protein S13
MSKDSVKTVTSSVKILGIQMPVQKHVHIALTRIYGIGLSTSLKICKKLEIDMTLRLKQLDETTIARISKYIEEDLANEGHLTESNLKRQKNDEINRLKLIKCYRGVRLSKGLPRNSRTKTNAKTTRVLLRRMGGDRRSA